MRMKRRAIAMSVTVLLALLPILTGLAAPLDLTEDLKGSVRIELTDQAQYIYSYAYPQVDPADSSAELINTFYQTIARDAEEFEIPMNADYYREQKAQKNITVEISYEVTCNNDDFFSVLLNTRQGSLETYTGHTFSRKGLKPGSSVALPYLLGLLESEESDTWLQNRQTGKADDAVRKMVWERLRKMDGIEIREDLQEEDLEYVFFPEEDFYLDETGEPVFYLQPGFADDSTRLVTIPISVDDILDEM